MNVPRCKFPHCRGYLVHIHSELGYGMVVDIGTCANCATRFALYMEAASESNDTINS